MYTIQSLHIYPIKGLKGIQLNKALLMPQGLDMDRRWMLVDDQGVFLSQRTQPELSQFQVEINKDQLLIKYRDTKFQFSKNDKISGLLRVRVFEDAMNAEEVSREASEWFSNQLDAPVKLVKHGENTSRIKNFKKYIEERKLAAKTRSTIGDQTVVSFADGYPYLIIGTASLDLLNQKLSEPLAMDRFRPNMVVKTSIPHEEDYWNKITVGDQELFVVKSCARCQVTTVDQQTGKKGKEPLASLSQYRKENNKIYFGSNAISLTSGWIRSGDSLIAESY